MLFGICPRTSRTPKLWHMFMITYNDFVVIVEPWTPYLNVPLSFGNPM